MSEAKKNLLGISFLHAAATTAYITGIALFLSNAGKIFGEKDTFLTPVAFLMTFVISAAITGSLVLGRPVLWFLSNRRKEAVMLFVSTLGWLAIGTIALFTLLIIWK